MKHILLLFLVALPLTEAIGQEDVLPFSLHLGANFNQSSTAINSTTGIGLFLEPAILVGDRYRLGYRFEPTALAYGVGVIWDACNDGECREGANYVLNNYLKADYLIGQPKINRNGARFQTYAGVNLIILTHRRWVIQATGPQSIDDTQQWVTNTGMGIRFGALLGRFDLSVSLNRTGADFQDYIGFNLGYDLLKNNRRE